jgi:hypothetical protein
MRTGVSKAVALVAAAQAFWRLDSTQDKAKVAKWEARLQEAEADAEKYRLFFEERNRLEPIIIKQTRFAPDDGEHLSYERVKQLYNYVLPQDRAVILELYTLYGEDGAALDEALAWQKKQPEKSGALSTYAIEGMGTTQTTDRMGVDEYANLDIPREHLSNPSLQTPDERLALTAMNDENQHLFSDIEVAQVKTARARVRQINRELVRSGRTPDGGIIPRASSFSGDWESQSIFQDDFRASKENALITLTMGHNTGLTPEIARTILSGPSARFYDSEKRYINPATGAFYTFTDYGNMDDLTLDADTLMIMMERALPITKVPHPRDLNNPTFDVPKHLTTTQAAEVVKGWGRGGDTEKFKAFQQQLWDAGFYTGASYYGNGATAPLFGVLDDDSLNAIEDYFTFYMHVQPGVPVDEHLAGLSGTRERFNRAANGGGGSGAQALEMPVLRGIIEEAGRQLLGYSLPEDQVMTLAGVIRNSSSGTSSGEAQYDAMDRIREQYSVDAGAHDLAATFDMFASLLGAGGSTGTGQFGTTEVGSFVKGGAPDGGGQ